MIRIVQIALYLVVMSALAWALGLFMPEWVESLQAGIGTFWSGVLIFGLIPLGILVAYLAGRSESGSAREP